MEKYNESLEMKSIIMGRSHISVANTIEEMANLLLASREDETPLEFYSECLAIKKDSLERHTSVADMLMEIACIISFKKTREAVELAGEAVDIRTECLGKDHPDAV